MTQSQLAFSNVKGDKVALHGVLVIKVMSLCSVQTELLPCHPQKQEDRCTKEADAGVPGFPLQPSLSSCVIQAHCSITQSFGVFTGIGVVLRTGLGKYVK